MIEIRITGENIEEVRAKALDLLSAVSGTTAPVEVDAELFPAVTNAEEQPEPSLFEPTTGTTEEGPVDPKGVPFDSDMCSAAKDPFYLSGLRKDQWKRRKGVGEDVYDKWYSDALSLVPPATQQDSPLDTSSAFGASEPETAEPVPTDCGTFMGWVSAHQAAGRLTQQQVTDAYFQLNIDVASLFPPNSASEIAQRVAQLHGLLAQQL